jgi:hypothetical protein
MNQTDLIKRAFGITRRYRVLWIFGILLALAGGGGGSGDGGGGGGNGGTGLIRGLARPGPGAILGTVLLLCCLLVIVIIVAVIVRYVARTALYRMVDHIEETGASPTWREGFRLGWTNRALRLFLLDLIVGIVFVVAAVLLLVLAASPLLLLVVRSSFFRAVGIATTVALELSVVLILIVAAVIVSLLSKFWAREIALADRSIGQALATGYALVRGRLADVGVMWLLMLGIGIGFGIAFFVLLIALLMLAGAVGAGIGFAVHAITNSVLLAVLAGVPPFLLILIVPLTFILGLYLVFESSTWTLTYREVVRGPTVHDPAGQAGPVQAGEDALQGTEAPVPGPAPS